jgi:hypothetical protein
LVVVTMMQRFRRTCECFTIYLLYTLLAIVRHH